MVRPNPPQVQVRTVREVFRDGVTGFWTHPEWEAECSWLAQGTTGRDHGRSDRPWDFALFGETPSPGARSRWDSLGTALGFGTVAHSHQVHGTEVLSHGAGARSHQAGTPSDAGADGAAPTRSHQRSDSTSRTNLLLGSNADGHICRIEGILLGVTIADCVPVFLVDPGSRAVGLLHAGWRGAVAGILEAGMGRMRRDLGIDPENLRVHLGPSICRDCFEVGPEVHRVMGLPDPAGPRPVDLRGYLARRGAVAGIDPDRVTESAWCTLCDGSPFFSHRRGEGGRQVGFLGIRAAGVSGSSGRGPGR